MVAAHDEIELIIRAKQGDFKAFELLYEMRKIAIYRAALSITGNRFTAEEILQETFLRAFKHITKYRRTPLFRPGCIA